MLKYEFQYFLNYKISYTLLNIVFSYELDQLMKTKQASKIYYCGPVL